MNWLDSPATVWRREVGDQLLGGYATLQDARRTGIVPVMIPFNPERPL